MHKLTVIKGGEARAFAFQGQPLLDDVLIEHGLGLAHPCGGRGSCGKCRVEVQGCVSPMNAAERQAGCRLCCQVRLYGDCVATLQPEQSMAQIAFDADGEVPAPSVGRGAGYGIAADIGTTTLAVALYSLEDGACLARAGGENPQRVYAADVMGRIDAALKGELCALQALIENALRTRMEACCAQAAIAFEQVERLVVTGNTTMLYLLMGRNPKSLAFAPFHADHLFGEWVTLLGKQTYLPPCMNAFVGADITCAALFSSICNQKDTALLCDVGTNGELALWSDGTLWVSSTAAGPAFEGACITCGVDSIPGAIDHVWVDGAKICCHTLEHMSATGLCGSGLVDAVAAFLKLGLIDETGAMDHDKLTLTGSVALYQADVRNVQLAKAAVGAGITVLMKQARIPVQQVKTLYLAGGFGSTLNVHAAASVGLLPDELADRTVTLGNAALAGARMILTHHGAENEARRIAQAARHVDLGGNPLFGELYVENMGFDM